MITATCDSCGKAIDRGNDAWFGVDHTPAPEPIDADDPDGPQWLPAIRLGDDHEFHFCSASCVSAWAFDRQLKGLPNG